MGKSGVSRSCVENLDTEELHSLGTSENCGPGTSVRKKRNLERRSPAFLALAKKNAGKILSSIQRRVSSFENIFYGTFKSPGFPVSKTLLYISQHHNDSILYYLLKDPVFFRKLFL